MIITFISYDKSSRVRHSNYKKITNNQKQYAFCRHKWYTIDVYIIDASVSREYNIVFKSSLLQRKQRFETPLRVFRMSSKWELVFRMTLRSSVGWDSPLLPKVPVLCLWAHEVFVFTATRVRLFVSFSLDVFFPFVLLGRPDGPLVAADRLFVWCVL